jgi:hypothetical protein
MSDIDKQRKLKLKDEDTFFEDESVVSSTECTGLVQTPPTSVDEANSYSEIYDVPHTKEKVNNHIQND